MKVSAAIDASTTTAVGDHGPAVVVAVIARSETVRQAAGRRVTGHMEIDRQVAEEAEADGARQGRDVISRIGAEDVRRLIGALRCRCLRSIYGSYRTTGALIPSPSRFA